MEQVKKHRLSIVKRDTKNVSNFYFATKREARRKFNTISKTHIKSTAVFSVRQ